MENGGIEDLITLPESYTNYLRLFVIRDKFVQG